MRPVAIPAAVQVTPPPPKMPTPSPDHFSMTRIQQRFRTRRRKALVVWDGRILLGDKFCVNGQMLHHGQSSINRIPDRNLKICGRVLNSVASDIFKTTNNLTQYSTPIEVRGDTMFNDALQGSWIVLPAKIDSK